MPGPIVTYRLTEIPKGLTEKFRRMRRNCGLLKNIVTGLTEDIGADYRCNAHSRTSCRRPQVSFRMPCSSPLTVSGNMRSSMISRIIWIEGVWSQRCSGSGFSQIAFG